ncbi:glycogen debranching protein GlgX [Rhodococcus rhodnii]|uniref:Isoamylase n=1 Tax=Rhodococcus rhodnii LMG 5362 TaxID=1273125 RepID=R7WLW5_9NOCA|nr:glycogen debranching protein GlgX [Rhodococcus rhodnii]EOM76287.1 isoamylase [Rhodococcus rhodnii LMG 5362]
MAVRSTPEPSSPFPLGSTYSRVAGGGATRFAVHAPDADAVDVRLLGDDGREERVALTEQTYGVWHGVVEGVRPGRHYGYRAHGPWEPRRGVRIAPAKVLLDPWGRRVTGRIGDRAALRAYAGTDPFGERSDVNSWGHTPLSVVAEPDTPAETTHPRTPWEETVIYELHVGSFTARRTDIPREVRGTYLGLAHPAVIEYLVGLGVTAVELMPVHAIVTEESVHRRGMRNHWGYSTAGFFAPHPGYAVRPGEEIGEFRAMVAALHRAGIEVILDVVYNHTCEERTDGISLSWRGLDCRGYYLLDADGADVDLTGCGNTIDASSPVAVRMITDSLRYWATVMGVDGFRFDLATALARRGGASVDPRGALLTAITTDPVLAQCKLIAEPWDATGTGYGLGAFEPAWSEWNDRYRDTVRRFWNGEQVVGEFASRVAGSEDIFGHPRRVGHLGGPLEPWGGRRRPWASINFVTAHDGFSATDLVSYTRKHNEANGENSRDGTDHNHSVNHGVEGPTSDPAVVRARGRHVRALLATLVFSTGTPMLRAGDEFGASTGGNNNTYCVPEETPVADAWPLDWEAADDGLLDFVTRALALRRVSPALRQPEFFSGRAAPDARPDLVWFDRDGVEMTDASWHSPGAVTVQSWIECAAPRAASDDDSRLVVAHAGPAAEVRTGRPEWFDGTLVPEFDSSTADGVPTSRDALPAGSVIHLDGPTLLVLRVVGRPPRNAPRPLG